MNLESNNSNNKLKNDSNCETQNDDVNSRTDLIEKSKNYENDFRIYQSENIVDDSIENTNTETENAANHSTTEEDSDTNQFTSENILDNTVKNEECSSSSLPCASFSQPFIDLLFKSVQVKGDSRLAYQVVFRSFEFFINDLLVSMLLSGSKNKF